jgi:CRP-like cAMP-binding protein
VPRSHPSKFDTSSFVDHIKDGRKVATFANGQEIFGQGDAAETVFYIVDGRVKLGVVSRLGKEAVLAMLSKDDFFGESCLIGHALRVSSATALSDVTLIQIDKSALLRALREEPPFSEFFIRHLLSRTVRIEADLVDQLFNSSEKRLARVLLLMANYDSGAQPQPIIAKVSQETLAEIVGTTRSRVSFFMNKFRRLGFISYNGRIEVHRSLLTVVLQDGDNE